MKPETVVAFLDTNYCLHYPLPDQTDWPTLLGAKNVRLVACLGLVDELDEKKSHPTRGIADRAARWIKIIEASVDAPSEVRKNVTLEIYASPTAVASHDMSKGDASIVTQAKEFEVESSGVPVVVVSEDSGMLIRCRSAGVNVAKPDRAVRLDDPVSDLQKQNAALAKELHAIKNARPDLKLRVHLGKNDTDSTGPLSLTLVKPKPGHFAAELAKWFKIPFVAESINLQGYGQSRIERATKWGEIQEQVRDESARTLAFSLTLDNLDGKLSAKNVELTLSYDANVIVAEAHQYALQGRRTKPEPFPHLIDGRIVNDYGPNRVGSRMIEAPRLQEARSVPSNLNMITNGPSYIIHTLELSRGKFVWKEDLVGHGKSSPTQPFYLTFNSWDDVKPLNLSVRV